MKHGILSKAAFLAKLVFLFLLSIPQTSNANGADAWQLDSRFGTEGKLVESLGANKEVRIYAAGLSPDGKLILGGSVKDKDTGTSSCLLASYDLFGRIDTSFGEEGKVINGDRCAAYHAIAFQYGKIVATGISSEGTEARLVIARHLPTGAVDPNFAGGLAAMNPASLIGKGMAVAVDSVGRIVIAGEINPAHSDLKKGVGLRLSVDGTLDLSFGDRGITEFSRMTRASAVELLEDGRLLVGGSYSSTDGTDDNGYMVLARVLDNGALDSSFGDTHNERGYSMYAVPGEATLTDLVAVTKSDIKIIASGFYSDRDTRRHSGILGSYDAEGRLSGATWDHGKHLPLSGFLRPFAGYAATETEAHSLQLSRDGTRLVVTGVSIPDFGDFRTAQFTAARYLIGFTSLLSDPLFDDGRPVRVKLGCSTCGESARATVIGNDDSFAVAGYREETDGSSSIAVAAFGNFAAYTAARRTATANPAPAEAVPYERAVTAPAQPAEAIPYERALTPSERPAESSDEAAPIDEPNPRESVPAFGNWNLPTGRLPLFPRDAFRWPSVQFPDFAQAPTHPAGPQDEPIAQPETLPPAEKVLDQARDGNDGSGVFVESSQGGGGGCSLAPEGTEGSGPTGFAALFLALSIATLGFVSLRAKRSSHV